MAKLISDRVIDIVNDPVKCQLLQEYIRNPECREKTIRLWSETIGGKQKFFIEEINPKRESAGSWIERTERLTRKDEFLSWLDSELEKAKKKDKNTKMKYYRGRMVALMECRDQYLKIKA